MSILYSRMHGARVLVNAFEYISIICITEKITCVRSSFFSFFCYDTDPQDKILSNTVYKKVTFSRIADKIDNVLISI